jgi:uncharacterized protein (TIGR03067 family)
VIAADPKAGNGKDEKLIQGYWLATSVRQDGKELPKQEGAKVCIVFTDKRLSFGTVGQEPMSVNYTLDTAKTPGAIDTTHELERGKPIVQLGIYSLEGDRLKLSIAAAGKARPITFCEKAATTFILRRSKAPRENPNP